MTTEHTHLEDTDVERQPEADGQWFRVYIDNPDYLNEHGKKVPKLLAGGRRSHCEAALARYREQTAGADEWPSQFVEMTEDMKGRDPKVSFE